jgi:hypothetical protein
MMVKLVEQIKNVAAKIQLKPSDTSLLGNPVLSPTSRKIHGQGSTVGLPLPGGPGVTVWTLRFSLFPVLENSTGRLVYPRWTHSESWVD